MKTFDERRTLVVPGEQEETLHYAAAHLVDSAKRAINLKGSFYLALSGGSTPKQIFQLLASNTYKDQVDWSKTFLFWSDERAVPPDSPESNYHMALVEGKLKTLPIPPSHIFRLKGEGDLEQNALEYERVISKNPSFDLIMLGMGEDGHTASLFPHTAALSESKRLVVANYLPEKKIWRLTFTYPLIAQAKEVCFYLLGANKAEIIEKVLKGPFLPDQYPSQRVGTKERPALFILDKAASYLL